MAEIKLISFDIGNTLIKTVNGGFCRKFQEACGIPFSHLQPLFQSEFLTKDVSMEKAVMTVSYLVGFANYDQFITDYRPNTAELFDDTIQVLDELRSWGIPIVAISNCTPWETNGLDGLGIRSYLKEIVYSFNVGYAKPDNRIFKIVENTYDVLPQEIVHIGDSWYADVEGALMSNWNAIYLNREDSSKATHQYVPIARSLSQLPAMIRTL